MNKNSKNKRVYKLSNSSQHKRVPRAINSRYHLLGDNSGYPAAEYNFGFLRSIPLVIMEQNEENSSWHN
jgi:hypothetical protein